MGRGTPIQHVHDERVPDTRNRTIGGRFDLAVGLAPGGESARGRRDCGRPDAGPARTRRLGPGEQPDLTPVYVVPGTPR